VRTTRGSRSRAPVCEQSGFSSPAHHPKRRRRKAISADRVHQFPVKCGVALEPLVYIIRNAMVPPDFIE
jgi:hypothetical protein